MGKTTVVKMKENRLPRRTHTLTIENAHSWQIGPIVGPGAARFGVFEASINSVVHHFSVGADPLALGGDRLGSGVGNKFQNPRDPGDSRYLQD